MQIRNTSAAAAFREWSTQFAEVIQNGDLSELGRYIKEVRDVVRAANAGFGLTDQSDVQLSLGWGPASKAFDLPRLVKKPFYLKRHLWLLNEMSSAAAIARIS